MSTTATPTTSRPSLRESLAARRDRRAARLRLERDLATYSTPAERQEIAAIVARYDGAETSEVESILARQATPRVADSRHLLAGAR